MTCAEARELIEAVAAGEIESDAFRAHVTVCPACADALARAIRIERALAALPAPAAPAQFSQTLRARIRKERWRSEERVDRAFNVAIGVGVVFVVAAVLALLNLGSVAEVLLVAVDAVGEAARQPSPLPRAGPVLTVSLTAGLVAVAAAIWWWAERRGGYQET